MGVGISMSLAPSLQVRAATADDAGTINEIYNEAVATTTATFDTQPKLMADRQKWMDDHVGRYAVLVAEAGAAGVVGWASLSRWSDRPAYDATGESSVYVASAWRGKGIGKSLMDLLMKEADRHKFHVVLARITTDNAVSIRLHEQLGFEPVGVMREVGLKFGKRHDVLMMQRLAD